MTNQIIVFTQTHNSEKTLKRCIDSVLNQTYQNIAALYIADNGSIDGTCGIIAEYAKRDSRIVPLYRKDNIYWQIYFCLPQILEKYGDDDYFIALDSDDEYDLTAFKKMVSFLNKNHLDAAACCSDLICAETGADLNKKPIDDDLIVYEDEFGIKFPQYFRFFMDYLGCIFPLSILRRINYDERDNTFLHSSPTFIFFETLKISRRIGVVSEKLYKYYISPQSTERSGSKRLLTVKIYNYFRNFVMQKCGCLSKENKAFLYSAYFKALRNRLTPILQSSVLSAEDKVELFKMVVDGDMTKDMCEFILSTLELECD
jgi:glycosyltransferase involved in cell wall biosynthesis